MAQSPFDPDGPPANGGRAPAGVPESDIADSVGRVSAAARQNRQQAEDDTFITAGVAAAFSDFDALFEERKAAATQGPDGFAETFSQDLRDAVPALMDRLRADGHRPSEAGIDGLAQRLEMIRGQFGTRAITHENNTRVLGMAANLDRTLEGLAERALADPERLDALMVSAGDALRRAGSHLDPAALESRRPALQAIAEAAVLGRIGQDPLGAINDLEIGFFDQDLPRPAQEKLMRRAEAALRDQEAAAELALANEAATARAETFRRLIALEGAIGRGEAGERDIIAATDILNEPARARLSNRLETRKAEDVARAQRITTVAAVLDGKGKDPAEEGGGDAIRPGAPGWQTAVNEHYATLAPTLDELDPDERARFDEDYAKKTGILPDPAANHLRAGLLSADPAEQARAAERLVRFRDIDPALLAAISEDERARAETIHGFAALGLPSERSVELADLKLEEERQAGKVVSIAIEGDAEDSLERRALIDELNAVLPQIIDEGGAAFIDELPPETAAAIRNGGEAAFEAIGELFRAEGSPFPAVVRAGSAPANPGKVLEQIIRVLGPKLGKKLTDFLRKVFGPKKEPRNQKKLPPLPPVPPIRQPVEPDQKAKPSGSIPTKTEADKIRSASPDDETIFEKTTGGNVFVRGKDGSSILGNAPRIDATGETTTELPIKLRRTDFKHVDTKGKRRNAQNAGYEDGWELTQDVAANWTEIREGHSGRLVLVKRNGKNKVAIVEISKDKTDDIYRIVTTGVRSDENIEGLKPVFKR